MHTIAIIDDDVPIGDLIATVLAEAGYRTLRAYSGTEAVYLLSQHRPDLILLDLMLPGLSGEEVLRHANGIPVIVVSARVGVEDKVNLLSGGAQDYITKPFDLAELLARVQVQLRRAGAAQLGGRLHYDALTLDEDTRLVTVQDTPIHLTKTEFAILKQLMENPHQVIPKSRMLDLISLDTPDGMESSLKVHVSNLRTKLKAQSGKDYIEAVWGIGFKLRGE